MPSDRLATFACILAAWCVQTTSAWDYAQNGADWSLGECASGVTAQQSPIDVPSTPMGGGGGGNKLFLKYPYFGRAVKLYNSGHSLALTLPNEYRAGFGLGGSIASLKGEGVGAYRLWQVNFHAPSEHTVGGQRMPLEMQMVHQSVGGELGLAVVVVLFNARVDGSRSELLDVVAGAGLPGKAWDEVLINLNSRPPTAIPKSYVNALDLGLGFKGALGNSSFYEYDGSLTVPPCDSKVKYFVRQNIVPAAPQQFDAFRKVLQATCPPQGNYRGVPPWSTSALNLKQVDSVDAVDDPSGFNASGSSSGASTGVSSGVSGNVTDAQRALVIDNPNFQVTLLSDSDALRAAKEAYQQASSDYQAAQAASLAAENALQQAQAAVVALPAATNTSTTNATNSSNVSASVNGSTASAGVVAGKLTAAVAAADRVVAAKAALDASISQAAVVLQNEQPTNDVSSNSSASVAAAASAAMLPRGRAANPFEAATGETVARVGLPSSTSPLVPQVPAMLAPNLRQADGPAGGYASQAAVPAGPLSNSINVSGVVFLEQENQITRSRGIIDHMLIKRTPQEVAQTNVGANFLGRSYVQTYSTLSTSAERAAKLWLSSHQSPADSELGELATSNPQAFAIVSGLLNKRHQNTLPVSERGPDVFLKMMGPRHLSATASNVALPYDVPQISETQPVIQDQMNYDPKSADDKDEQMVDGLLSAVEGLTGKRSKKIGLLRKRHHKGKQGVAVDGPFGNPFGYIAPKPTAAPAMSEEEKEQRAAAGLPLTTGTNAFLAKQTEPRSVDTMAVEQAMPATQTVEKPEGALFNYLR